MSAYLKILFPLAVLSFGFLLSGAGAASAAGPLVREQREVAIDGVKERWRFEWSAPPREICGPDDPDWFTCPCMGFAFGEAGNLLLVREIPSKKKEERLELASFFDQNEYDFPGDPGEAVLRRWNTRQKDNEKLFQPRFASEARKRPRVRMMNFGDYNRDGRASEFLLQIGTLPCGKKMSIAIGVSKKKGELHALSSQARPDRPLVLQAWQWEELRQAKGAVKVVSWPCGDHGSVAETELELRAENGAIHAIRREFECTAGDRRGKLISEESF